MNRLRLLGLALALILVQQLVSVLLPHWARPDLLLALALALGLRTRPTESLVVAFLLGFTVDALSVTPPGMYALLRGTACAASRVVDRTLFLRAPAPWVLLVGLWALVDGLLLAGLIHAFAPESALPWGQVALRAPLTALATAVLAVPILVLVQWADGESDTDTAPLVGSRP